MKTKTDVETAMGQTTDGDWITSEELLKGVADWKYQRIL